MATSRRRSFLKAGILGSVYITLPHQSIGCNKDQTTENDELIKSAEEMRPGEITKAIQKGPYAFIPVSPMFEWHSFHLPMGTDALITEELARQVASQMGGIWFRPLSFGLDAWRTNDEKERWGFSQDDEVYGMNFPELPIHSEYCQKEEMILAISNRLNAVSKCGIKHAFLMNHHGGKGQMKLIEDLADKHSNHQLKVHAIRTYQFNDLNEDEGFYNIGGHAGYSETSWLMAFRPELVDLSEQDAGELSVRQTGILHHKPQIEPEWNPRNVNPEVAEKLHMRVIGNFIQYICNLQ
jgi:creatinine amidohydrolase/Fe(II)-dependent formamide hydrolase-like protein